jgi:HEAT repeat protein
MWLALSQVKSSDVARRLKAIQELAQVSDMKAMLALSGALTDAVPRVRIAAAQAIAVQHNERCVQPLLSALRDPHAGVREAVLGALKAIGHKSAIPYIAPLLCDVAPRVRAHAAHALRSLDWQPENDDQEAFFCIAVGRFSKAAEFGAVAVESLVSMITDESSSVRRSITEALADIQDPRATAAVVGRLEDPDPGVRRAALGALGRRRDPAYAPLVLEQMAHVDKNIRVAALEALVKIGSPDLFEVLAQALQDPHWNVRAVAASALGSTNDKRAIAHLAKALNEADGDVRQVVAEAFGRLRDRDAIEPLILAQLDPDSAVRQSITAALHQIDPDWTKSEGAQRTLPALKRALKHSDYGVRQTAADLLNRIFNIRQCEPSLLAEVDAESARRQRAVDVLASVLWDDDVLVRFAGVWALHQIGDTRAAGPVATKLKDAEPLIRRAAERALADFGLKDHQRQRDGRAVQHSEDWGTGPVA